MRFKSRRRRQSSGVGMLFDWTPEVGSNGGTFMRASTATYRDADGVLRTAALNKIRNDHYVKNPVTNRWTKTTLLEPSQINNATFSEDTTDISWNKNNLNISANSTSAPDGNLTADKIIETAIAGTHHISKSFTFTANTYQSLSIFLKAAERTRVQVYFINVDRFGIEVDLSTGSVVANLTTGSATLLSSKVTEYANGFYRIEISGKINAVATNGSLAVLMKDAGGLTSYTGDGVSGIYIWGLQHDLDSPCATSYVPTTGATVTRSVDQLNFPYTAPPAALTLYSRFIELGGVHLATPRLIALSSGDPRLLLQGSGSSYAIQHRNGVGSVTSAAGANSVVHAQIEVRATLYADGSVECGISINGAAESVGARSASLAFASAWLQKIMYIANSVANPACAAFESCKVAAGERTLAQMRSG